MLKISLSIFIKSLFFYLPVVTFLFSSPVPPSIEEAESLVAATVNSRTQLRCEALGLPDPRVTWYREGERIPDNGLNYRMHRSGTLEFSSVREDDSGDYKCVATNDAGEVSREVTLDVQGEPQEIFMCFNFCFVLTIF